MESEEQFGNLEIMIGKDGNWEPLKDGNWELLNEITSESIPTEGNHELPSATLNFTVSFVRLTGSILLSTAVMREFNELIEAHREWLKRLPPIRVRTGIRPKQSRTRRKQRLTRLQRRHKRQTKNRRKA
jgi:hypothetical protein